MSTIVSRPQYLKYDHISTCTKIEFPAENQKCIEVGLSISSKIYGVMKCEMANGKNVIVEQNAYNIEYISW